MARHSSKKSHPEPAPQAASAADLIAAGIQLHQQGGIEQAAELYSQALCIEPDNPQALHLAGVIRHQMGAHREAIELIGRAVELAPDVPDAQINLGAAYYADGNVVRAEEHFRRGAELNPLSSEAHSNLAAALNDLGRVDEAIASHVTAQRASPAVPKFIKRLGDLYVEHDRPADALEQFKRYLELDFDNGEVQSNAGYAAEQLGRFQEAEAYYRRAHALVPNSPEIANNLAGVLLKLDRRDEAGHFFETALSIAPEKWEDLVDVAGAYANRGDTERAMQLFHMLLDKRPDDPVLLNNYGVTLGMSGKTSDAIVQFEHAVALDPNYADAWNNLGAGRLGKNDRIGAIEAFKQVIRIQPRQVAAHVNVCLALLYESRYDEAYMYARATVMLEEYLPSHFPNANKVFRSVCDYESIAELGDPMEIVGTIVGSDYGSTFLELLATADSNERIDTMHRLHVKWGGQVSRYAQEKPLPAVEHRRRTGKVRIGLLSSDLRSHSVAKFVFPLIRNYDRERYEIYCYTPYETESDPMQARIKGLVEGFRTVENRSPRDIAGCIQDDGIDIQFELNGFTKDTKLRALSYKPAPVQVYWLGYPFTTGMPEMDHIVLDPYFRPEKDDRLVEEPLILPETWVCFGATNEEPISPEAPFERNGMITFGTLNNTYKFTPDAIATWARIMHEVPDSRFLLVRPECSSMHLCTNLTREFEKNGIGPDRLHFVNNHVTGLPHLAFYDEIDLSLDSFPLVGGTTTCDALWMGVPVISLVGPCTHQRMGYSILNNVGAGELCAFSLDEYIAKGIALANDPTSLKEYRAGLRPAMKDSPLCQAERYAENFQNMLDELVERHNLR